MLDDTRELLTTRNFAIRPDQEAMLIMFAKEVDRSVSGALRFILDDWITLKQAGLEVATTPLSAQPQEDPS